ncbi:hypothetical protein GCM10018785_11910 [Streptomyces longispororuber]|uniref:Uncharacterized protein n=1 Tax=Streptomyces longispororuber TaxID=68230 RepID=A0A918ZC24_9ACTN|nr:hypothetical protein GCM10018785_11910 [Streptomyces longispororuber]
MVTLGWSADSGGRCEPDFLRPVEHRLSGPPGEGVVSEVIGSVAGERFEALVDRSVELVRVMTGCQFACAGRSPGGRGWRG